MQVGAIECVLIKSKLNIMSSRKARGNAWFMHDIPSSSNPVIEVSEDR